MANQHNTFRRWFAARVSTEDCGYIREYGIAQAAPPGLIYYCDTTALYAAYKQEIWEIALDDGGDIASLTRRHDLAHPTNFENFMVWAAAERLAHERK